MSAEGMYSFDKAYGEAEQLRKRVGGEKNITYGEAEKGLETQETEESKRAKILDFLAQNLPPTEERITEPMKPNCDVCVVIPAYSERNNILRPIASLANQKGVNFNQFELIVVVNNPPVSPERDAFLSDDDYTRRVELYEKGVGDNQETLKLIRHINGEDVDIALTEKEKETIAGAQRAGLRVFAVDKATMGKTLPKEDANVGGARNRGLAEAVARFYGHAHKNGIIAQTDAETRVGETYVRDLIEFFKQKPEIVGITGPIDYEESPEDNMLFREVHAYSYADELYRALVENLLHKTEEKRVGSQDKKQSDAAAIARFSGANMASRAFEAAIVGGVPKIPGGEDPAFGFRLATVGKTERIFHITATTLRRISARTTTGGGHELIKRIQFMDKHKGALMVKSPSEIASLHRIRGGLERAIESGHTSAENLQSILSLGDKPILDTKRLEILSLKIQNRQGMRAEEILTTLAAGDDRDAAQLFDSIRTKISDILEPMPLATATAQLINLFQKNQDVHAKFDARRKLLVEEENNQVKRRENTLKILLDVIFEDKPAQFSTTTLVKIITAHKEQLRISDDEIKTLEETNPILDALADTIAKAQTKQKAEEAIGITFKDYLAPLAESPLKLQTIELIAMLDTLEEIDIDLLNRKGELFS
ncbi:MAG TPA: glycosyltransferase family 2 protein [Candidatus Paceibacterota bacterium]